MNPANYLITALIVLASWLPVNAVSPEYSGYLFVYFTGNDKPDEAIRFAVSDNSLNFKALNNNDPVIASDTISETGGVRDPHILRAVDGKWFYMVATDMVSALGWDSNRGLTLLKSPDLIHWTASPINIQQRFEGNDDLLRVWAPQTIFDSRAGKYMVYWSMKHGDGPDIIYYAYANDDFTDFITEPKPLFLPADGQSCIDGDIVCVNGTYHLFYKTEGHGNGIKKASTRNLTAMEWVESPDYKQQTDKAVEGSGIFKINDSDSYMLMYDVYMNGEYQFTTSSDLDHFRIADTQVTMNFHPRHGTIIPITSAELHRLTSTWP
ncbi:MAG: glycoside hydrolase family 43 protein [Paramuribaculum sp.]|nr:glycoside hydrolase family 43 protein [Paramuribaculum sp.]MDE6303769.1 glycoside hydrolase family 43 protein [Paramuribaculum sp.]